MSGVVRESDLEPTTFKIFLNRHQDAPSRVSSVLSERVLRPCHQCAFPDADLEFTPAGKLLKRMCFDASTITFSVWWFSQLNALFDTHKEYLPD